MAQRYRTRQAADPEYLHAIGQAVYSFSILEWGVIWAAEQIEPGFMSTDHHIMTAGRISKQFKAILDRARPQMPEDVWQGLKQISDQLWGAVEMRSELLHAHPFTAADGSQLLGRRTRSGTSLQWDIEKVDAATRYFDDLGIELNDLFYAHLYPTPTWRSAAPLALPPPEEEA